MSRGGSGRIVLEIDPAIKDLLYVALAKRKLTLKDWFLGQCEIFIRESEQFDTHSFSLEKDLFFRKI